MSHEDKYFPFKKEFIDIVESFGYYNEMKGKFITLDLKRKNSFSKQISAPLGRIFGYFDTQKRDKKVHNLIRRIKVAFSALKGPFVKEIFADIFLLVAFGYLNFQFISRFHNLFAFLLVTVSIGILLKALITSVLYVIKSDLAVLQDYYGFKKFGNVLRADKYTFVKKIEHSKRMMVFYSAILLLLSLSVYAASSPILVYSSEYVNIVTFFLAIFLGTIQFFRNIVIHKNAVNAISNLMMAIVFLFLLITYVESLIQKNSVLTTMVSYAFYLIIILVVYRFAKDLLDIRNLHKWVISKSY